MLPVKKKVVRDLSRKETYEQKAEEGSDAGLLAGQMGDERKDQNGI